MIYAIQAKGTDFIKFGYTTGTSYRRRVETLQTGCPFELEELAMCIGDMKTERSIHYRLIQAGAHYRGEWFKDCEEARKIIAEMQQGSVRVDGVSLCLLKVWNRKVNNLAEINGRKPGGWALMKERVQREAPSIPMLPAKGTDERYDYIRRISLDRKARRAANKAARAAEALQPDTSAS